VADWLVWAIFWSYQGFIDFFEDDCFSPLLIIAIMWLDLAGRVLEADAPSMFIHEKNTLAGASASRTRPANPTHILAMIIRGKHRPRKTSMSPESTRKCPPASSTSSRVIFFSSQANIWTSALPVAGETQGLKCFYHFLCDGPRSMRIIHCAFACWKFGSRHIDNTLWAKTN